MQTLFIDDIDGSAAEGTVHFGLDSTEYEADLTAEHAQQLRDALTAYVCGWPGRLAVIPAGLSVAGSGDRRTR